MYKAEEYYKKAFDLTKDRNFKARCLFMMAKCDQKQIPVPSWDNARDYDDYQNQQKAYSKRIVANSAIFPTLAKEYATTPFYKEAYNTCSYLKDFVNRKK